MPSKAELLAANRGGKNKTAGKSAAAKSLAAKKLAKKPDKKLDKKQPPAGPEGEAPVAKKPRIAPARKACMGLISC